MSQALLLVTLGVALAGSVGLLWGQPGVLMALFVGVGAWAIAEMWKEKRG